MKNIITGTMAVIYGILANVFGLFTSLLIITVIAMFLDLLTRIYAAWVRPDEIVKSKKIGVGITKKIGLCILIVLGLIIDFGLKEIATNLGIQIPTKIIFTALILGWIFVREIISNLENLQHANIELPKWLLKALNITRDKIDNLGNSAIDNIDIKDKVHKRE